jgi:2-octaprenylphenol hydroxylase
VVIVGAGMVGTALACAFAQADRHVALLEAGERPAMGVKGEYDLRVSAISPASQSMFSVLGAWQGMLARRVSPFLRMCVWDTEGRGEIRFDSADLGEDVLGHIVENRVVQDALLERSTEFQQVDIFFGTQPAAIETTKHQASVHLDDGSDVQTSLIVGADGPDSAVRRLTGLGFERHDYQQRAVVCTVHTERPHDGTAWQRFLPTGPLAFLPLANGGCSIVWSTGVAQSDELLRLGDDAFGARLARAFGHRLGAIEAVGPRAAFPLRRLHAKRYVGERIALVGDAAHVIHPLAGQGVNLGLMDAAALAETVLTTSRDLASPGALRRYERWRRGENQIVMTVMDSFNWLFSNSLMPLHWVRNIGLELTDAAAPVKHQFMRYAMGRAGDLPRLARGLSIS